jgi:hypothetical protein
MVALLSLPMRRVCVRLAVFFCHILSGMQYKCFDERVTTEHGSMRKFIFALGCVLAAPSTSLAGSGGGGYNGTVVANVYEYFAAHGCPGAGFSLLNCSYHLSAPGYRDDRRSGHLIDQFGRVRGKL